MNHQNIAMINPARSTWFSCLIGHKGKVKYLGGIKTRHKKAANLSFGYQSDNLRLLLFI